MVQAAIDRIFAKVEAYDQRDLHNTHGLDELCLVCHYDDEALLHNTPIKGVGFSFTDLAKEVAKALSQDHGVFDRIFLQDPWENPKVVQVYPAVAP